MTTTAGASSQRPEIAGLIATEPSEAADLYETFLAGCPAAVFQTAAVPTISSSVDPSRTPFMRACE